MSNAAEPRFQVLVVTFNGEKPVTTRATFAEALDDFKALLRASTIYYRYRIREV